MDNDDNDFIVSRVYNCFFDIVNSEIHLNDDKKENSIILKIHFICNLSLTIDFVLRDSTQIWGSDDDTDIEYIYQHQLLENGTVYLTPKMIHDGWLKHIKHEEENFL